MALCKTSRLQHPTGDKYLTRPLQIIEGAVSGFAGIIVWFFLPDYPSVATGFLTEEERILACHRLALDGIGLSQGAHERMSNKKAFMLCIKDWRVWAFTFLFMLVCGSQTMQYFIPSLVEAFGWEGSQAQCKSKVAARLEKHAHRHDQITQSPGTWLGWCVSSHSVSWPTT